jgi:hypothetical protein
VIRMGKGTLKRARASNVVPLHAVRSYTADEALAYIAERGRVNWRGTEMAKIWGWLPRRAQKQLHRWIREGKVIKQENFVSVIAELKPVWVPPAVDVQKASRRDAVLRAVITLGVLLVVGSLNTWPRVAQIMSGEIGSSGWTFVALQILSLGVMSQIPFAKPETRAAKLKNAGFAALLVLANLSFSIEAIGHVRDADRDRKRATEQTIASMHRQLDEAREARQRLAFVPVSIEQVATAKKAVDDAEVAREQECGKVGDNCRKRISELVDRQDELGRLQANKTAADTAMSLDLRIAGFEQQIRESGPAPLEVDPGAARIAALMFGLLPATVVSMWWPTILSFVAEMLAMLGPKMIFEAVTGGRGGR